MIATPFRKNKTRVPIAEIPITIPYPLHRRRRRLSPRRYGGVPGYYNFVEAMRTRRHPEHADLKRGFGDDFDPTLLNRDKVKQSPEASSAKLTVKTVRGQGQRGEQ